MQGVKVHTVCPYCSKDVVLGSKAPGRYVATCSHCSRPYLYTFPASPQSPIVTSRLGPEMGTIDLPVQGGEAVSLGEDSSSADLSSSFGRSTFKKLGIESENDLNLDLGSVSEEAIRPVRPKKPTTKFRLRKKDSKAASTPWANLGEIVDNEGKDLSSHSERHFDEMVDRNLNSLISATGQTNAETRVGKGAAQKQDDHETDIAQMGGYEIVKQIGRGGMGSVYLAKQITLNREVALKLIHPKWSNRPRLLARFVREAYAVAQLSHPNIVQIFDIGEDQEQYFYAMEYVRGQSLKQLVETRNEALPPEEAASYILQAARGLHYVHGRSMVHRDIKPENLLLTDDGLIKIADLGLVKFADDSLGEDEPEAFQGTQKFESPSGHITLVEEAMGTPGYMAPEQCYDAATVDYRADIYALGCTLFALVAAQTPPNSHNADDSDWLDSLLDHHQHFGRLIDQKVPPALAQLISSMTAFDPDNRIQTMAEVIEGLEAYLAPVGQEQLGIEEAYSSEINAIVEHYNHVDAKEGRRIAVACFYGSSLALSAVLLFTLSMPQASFLVLILGMQTAMFHFVLSMSSEHYLMSKVKQYIKTFGKKTISLGLGAGVLVASGITYGCMHILAWADLLQHFLVMIPFAACIAMLFTKVMGRFIRLEQERIVSEMRMLLRKMRTTFCNEKVIREFLCEASGKNWEPIYESMFGYDEKMTKRKKHGKDDAGVRKPRWKAWRDPLIEKINQRLDKRRQDMERFNLAQIEQKALQANGVGPLESMRQAVDIADTLMTGATLYKATGHMPGKMRDLVSGEGLQIELATYQTIHGAPKQSIQSIHSKIAGDASIQPASIEADPSLPAQPVSSGSTEQTIPGQPSIPSRPSLESQPSLQSQNGDAKEASTQNISMPSMSNMSIVPQAQPVAPKQKKKLDYTKTTEGLANRLQRIDHLSENNTDEDWGSLNYLFGPHSRLVVGACLFLGWIGWIFQNASLVIAMKLGETSGLRLPEWLTGGGANARLEHFSDKLFNSFNFGFIGAALLASVLLSRKKLASICWIILPVGLFGPILVSDLLGGVSRVKLDMLFLVVVAGLVIWRAFKPVRQHAVEAIHELKEMKDVGNAKPKVEMPAGPQMKKPAAMHVNK